LPLRFDWRNFLIITGLMLVSGAAAMFAPR
jgi:hypothetical protein